MLEFHNQSFCHHVSSTYARHHLMTNGLILRVHDRSQIFFFFSIQKVSEDPDTFLLKNKQKLLNCCLSFSAPRQVQPSSVLKRTYQPAPTLAARALGPVQYRVPRAVLFTTITLDLQMEKKKAVSPNHPPVHLFIWRHYSDHALLGFISRKYSSVLFFCMKETSRCHML